jgi:signal transduction histidine kinase
VLAVGLHGIITFFNRAAEQLARTPLGLAHGQPPAHRLPRPTPAGRRSGWAAERILSAARSTSLNRSFCSHARRRLSQRHLGEVAHRRVLGNPSQMQLLSLNLCLNAIQAMELGGELNVYLANLSDGSGSTLIVDVVDSGAGIPGKRLATIFDPFVTAKPHGTGRGLAICRGLADAHHARLVARNNAGRPGCTFTVEFPVLAGRPTRIAP